jgi:hypothetical protein
LSEQQVSLSVEQSWRTRIFLVLATGLLAPAPAVHASCGYYVHSRNSPGEQQAGPDGERIHHPVKTPCQGPNCSGGQEQQPPMSPGVEIDSMPESGLITVLESSGAATSRFLADPGGPVRTVHHSSPLERPPRA